jgi:hypothetical protein
LDIDFVSSGIDSEVDTAAITSFCSGTTGRVAMYNQGLNVGDDASISTLSVTSQIIYQSGTLQTFKSKPAIYLNSTLIPLTFNVNPSSLAGYYLDKPCMVSVPCQPRYSGALRGILAERQSNTVAIGLWVDSTAPRWAVNYRPDGTSRVLAYNSAPTINTEYLYAYSKNNSGVVNAYMNGVKQTAEITAMGAVQFASATVSNIRWGAGTTTTIGNYFIGESPELVIYDFFDQTVLDSVMADQNAFYNSIY